MNSYGFPDETDLRTRDRDYLIRRILDEGAALHYLRLNGNPESAAEVAALKQAVSERDAECAKLRAELEEATKPRKNK